MKFKLVTLLILLVVVFAIGLIRTASKARRSQILEPAKNRLQSHVEQAKKEGVKEASIDPPTVTYLGSEDSNIDEVLSSYTVVVAQPIESRTYEKEGGNDLITWTKFRITEPLSEIRPPLCFGCNSLSPPTDILPLQSDEFLVPREGGTLVREGIRLTQIDKNYPLLVQGQYLMLISLYPSGVALTAGGPLGVFAVDSNENLAPLNKEPHALKDAVKTKFKASLRQVREKVKQAH